MGSRLNQGITPACWFIYICLPDSLVSQHSFWVPGYVYWVNNRSVFQSTKSVITDYVIFFCTLFATDSRVAGILPKSNILTKVSSLSIVKIF